LSLSICISHFETRPMFTTEMETNWSWKWYWKKMVCFFL